MPSVSLSSVVGEALARLRVHARVLRGPKDIAEVFSDLDDYPEFCADPAAAYDRGFIEGAAAALDVTVLELLEEFSLL